MSQHAYKHFEWSMNKDRINDSFFSFSFQTIESSLRESSGSVKSFGASLVCLVTLRFLVLNNNAVFFTRI